MKIIDELPIEEQQKIYENIRFQVFLDAIADLDYQAYFLKTSRFELYLKLMEQVRL